MKPKQLFVFFFLASINAFAQIRVSNINSVNDAVQKLAGDGVVISNVSYQFTGGGKPVGIFQDDFGILGVKEGLVLTSGSATNASGPNDSGCKTTINQNKSVSSPELESLVTKPIYDMVTVEFDIQVSSNLLEFVYVFGSDEYLEYVDGLYYDVFGFFISGPGINGVQNLAVLPNTQTPVSVGTINSKVNSNYYINNGTGATPLINIDVQYDGFTKPLKASAIVEPCKTYHIKLIIADVNDQTCDSGVFLENKSFTSKNIPKLTVEYEHDRFPYGIEDCNDFDLILTRGEYDLNNLNSAINYTYELLGTAIEKQDYEMISKPNQLKIPAGKSSIHYPFTVKKDALEEGEENILVQISSGCKEFLEVTSLSIPIKDHYEYKIPNVSFCEVNNMVINPLPKNQDQLTWTNSPYLSCLKCSSPTSSNTVSTWFYYEALDPKSTCKATDSVFVQYEPVLVDFDFSYQDCYTIQDIRFLNKSVNADVFVWNFGDNSFSSDANPLHQFGAWSTEAAAEYLVTLEARNTVLNCSAKHTKNLKVDKVLLIPNVITPNGDGKNDAFVIEGIIGDCWTFSVYNRYGKLIYTQENYKNDWSPSKISDGVYFYYLQSQASERIFKGTVSIIR